MRSWKIPNRSLRSFQKIDGIDSLTVELFQRATSANRSRDFEKKIEEQRLTGAIRSFFIKGGGGTVKNIQKIRFFSSESLTVDLFNDWREQFVHGRSFLKINKGDLIMVDLYKRSARAIRSWSIFFKDWKIEFPTLLHCNEFLSYELYFYPLISGTLLKLRIFIV